MSRESDFQFYEDKPHTRQEPIYHEWFVEYRRVYNVPLEASDIIPMKGDSDDSLPDTIFASTGVQTPRVREIIWKRNEKNTSIRCEVSWYQPRLYSSGTAATSPAELNGSRTTGETGNEGEWIIGFRYYVSTDGSSGVSLADTFPGDSGINRRVCRDIDNSDTKTMPGLFVTTCKYMGYNTTADTIGSTVTAINGWPDYQQDEEYQYVIFKGVSEDATSAPSDKALYTGDSGVSGRRLYTWEIDDDGFGFFVYTLKYRGRKTDGTHDGEEVLDGYPDWWEDDVHRFGLYKLLTDARADGPAHGVGLDGTYNGTTQEYRVIEREEDQQEDDTWIITIKYRGWKTTGSSIGSMDILEGYPDFSDDDNHNYIKIRGIALTTSQAPTIGAIYSGDSGASRRQVTETQEDDDGYGFFISEVTYRGYKLEGTEDSLDIKVGWPKTGKTDFYRTLEIQGVATSSSTGPAKGDTYSADGGTDHDRRVCVDRKVMSEFDNNNTIYHITLQYKGVELTGNTFNSAKISEINKAAVYEQETRKKRITVFGVANNTDAHCQPSRGTKHPDDSGSDLAARILADHKEEPDFLPGIDHYTLIYEAPIPYASDSATFMEIKGTRTEIEGEEMNGNVVVGVCDDTSNAYDEGDTHPDAAVDMICTDANIETEWLPGIHIQEARFRRYNEI